MLLTHIIIITLTVATGLSIAYQLFIALEGTHNTSLRPHPTLIGAAVISAMIILLLCLRSLGFGVDTVTYVDIFNYYCNGGNLAEYEASFRASTLLLNSAMLGSCHVELIPTVWVSIIAIPLLLMRVDSKIKIYYVACFLLSIVGIELATNALRQGLSVGVMVLAVSFGRKNPIAALTFALLSVLLHSSAALFITAYLIANLNWRAFLGVSVSLFVLTINSLDSQIVVPLASDFLYEIQKYASHESDEVWIRVLAFACVLSAIAGPVLARTRGKHLSQALGRGAYAVALRLSVLCLPFLALPYFGYRFIYGVYPLILYLTLQQSSPGFGKIERQFVILIALNSLILLAWSMGSSYMQEVPFLTF